MLKNGIVMKHFAEIERFSNHVYANVYCKAKRANAAKFLQELIKNMPYKVRSIQVDGGAEFMKDFEDASKDLGLPLFVLSPKNQRATAKSNTVIGCSERNFTTICARILSLAPAESL